MIVAPIWSIFVRFARALRTGWRDAEFRGLLYLVAVIVGSGTAFYRAVEDWSWLDSLYFSVITLTTVGYGDLNPTATGAKIFTVVYVLIGIGILITFIERVARYVAEDVGRRRRVEPGSAETADG